MNETVKTLYQVSDHSFNSNQTQDYHLSILLSGDGFSYVAGNKEPRRLIELGSFEFVIPLDVNRALRNEKALCLFSNFVIEHAWLGNPFGHSGIWIENRYSTLIPEALYDEHALHEYLSFNLQIPQDYILRSEYIPSIEAWNVFALPAEWQKQIAFILPSVKFHHASSCFIEAIIAHGNIGELNENVFIYPHRFYFEMAYTVKNKLIFYNTFPYSTQEDFIYFVLFGFEQLGLNPEIVPVILMVEIDTGSLLHLILIRYVRNVNFASRNKDVIYTYAFDQIPSHYFLNIIYSLQCEL